MTSIYDPISQGGLGIQQPVASSSPAFQSGSVNNTTLPSGQIVDTTALDKPILPNYNLAPSLTTTFPQTQPGTKTTGIVTSKEADDHINGMQSTTNQANTDLANHNAYTATQAQQDQQNKQTQDQQDIINKQNQQNTNASTSDSINSLMNELTGIQSTLARPNVLQQDVINNDPQEIAQMKYQLQQVSDSLKQMSLGTYPLTTGQQAQVTNVANQYASALADARKIQQAQVSGQTMLNAKTGIQMYSPTEALSNIQNIIDNAQKNITKINLQIVDAQDKLTTAIQDGDYKYATQLYNDVSQGIKDKSAELKDANDAVQKATDDMHQVAKDNATLQLQAIMDDHTISYQDKQQAISQATLDETIRKDLATEAVNQQIGGGVGSIPSVEMDATGNPDLVGQANFLSSLPPAQQTVVKGLTDYRMNPADFSTSARQSQGGLTRSQAAILAQQYDPTYDEKQYPSRSAFLKNVQSGTIFNNTLAMNTVISHIQDLQNDYKTLGITGSGVNRAGVNEGTGSGNAGNIGFINKITQGMKSGLGNQATQTAIAKVNNDISAIKTELAKVYKGGNASAGEQEIADWGKGLSSASTPGTIDGYVHSALNLVGGRLGAINDQYSATMGKPRSTPFLSQKSQQILKSMGIDPVDYEGVQSPTITTDTGSLINSITGTPSSASSGNFWSTLTPTQ